MLAPKSFLLQRVKADKDLAKDGGGPPRSGFSWMLALREEAVPMSFGVIGMTAASGMNLAFPKIIGKAIDVASGSPPPYELTRKGFVTAVLVIFAAGSFGSFLRTYSLGMAAERIAAKLRRRLYKAVLSQEIPFFHERKVGELVSRLSNDCTVTANMIVDVLANGYRSLNSAIGASCMLLTISPKLTLVSLSIVPLVGAGAMIFSKFSSSLAQKQQNAIADMSAISEERLQNIYTVKLFAAEASELSTFDDANVSILSRASLAKQAKGVFMGGLAFSVNCSLFSVLYFGGSLIASNELTVGSLTSFALYSGFMGLGFSSLASCFGEVRRAKESSKALFDLIESMPEDREEGKVLPTVQGHLCFDHVQFSYPTRKEITVLSDVNFEVGQGEVVAIVGTSGAGKSTIASLLSKLLIPTKGRILLDGVDTKELDTMWLRKQIGVVNQEPSLFATSVQENIMYGASTKDMQKMLSAAQLAYADDFIRAMPKQYETFVGEKGFELSGGQKQRIAIARALYRDSRVLLFDEATSSLDTQSEEAIRKALFSASKDRTVFIIAHRLSTIRQADRVMVLDDGVIAESGTFDELNQEGTKFHALVHRHGQF